MKITNKPYKNTLMALKTNVKFFKWNGKKLDYNILANIANGYEITLIFQVHLTLFNKINKERKCLTLVISTCKIINDINHLCIQ